jgi:UbiD family decarboxylase
MAEEEVYPDPMSLPIGTGPAVAGCNAAPHLAYDDLRSWIEETRRLGEIKEVKGLSWQEDIGMVSEMALRDDNAPCFIFEDVPGSIKGSRILVNFFGGKRKNMTLGFPTDLSKVELSEGFRVYYAVEMKRIPPRYVDNGPVMQNVMTGEDIDVTKFPTPQWHHPDGGRYIGTGSYNITRDPDTGWINCGTYRVMIHDKNSLGFYISPGKRGRQMRDKYQARRERMPVAVVCGGDPLSFLMGCSEVPFGISEFDILGGIRGTPIEVIKGPVTGLPIPANAEIAIEGFVEPNNMRVEGPFGEWTGYYASDVRSEPVLDIKAIYYRNEPILLGCPPERPGRNMSLSRCCALRATAGKHSGRGCAWRSCGVGARGRQRAVVARCRYQSALSRTCPTGWTRRLNVSRRCLLRPLYHRGRRRYRRVEPGGGRLGADYPLRSRHFDRYYSQCLVDAARSSDRAGAQGGR